MRKLFAALFFLGLADAALAQSAVVIPATTNQIALAGSVASITRIVTGQTGKSIYVTAVMLVPVATAAVTFSYGTGTNCNTGTATVAGILTFSAGQTLSFGDGYGAIWVIPSGNDLCITITAAAAPGSLAYSQF